MSVSKLNKTTIIIHILFISNITHIYKYINMCMLLATYVCIYLPIANTVCV